MSIAKRFIFLWFNIYWYLWCYIKRILYIEIEFKYWACAIKLKNTFVKIFIKIKHMRMTDLYLEPHKSQIGAKSRSKLSQRSTRALSVWRGREGKERTPVHSGSVNLPQRISKKMWINYLRKYRKTLCLSSPPKWPKFLQTEEGGLDNGYKIFEFFFRKSIF